jgi:uncharacterized caspase-like protein
MGRLATFILAVAVSLALATNASAEKRIALVIGNSAYQHTPELKNPRNDAADVAAALRALKFEVIEGLDLDKRAMEVTIRKFSASLKKADVGVLFYAGHGIQVAGQNYLVPIDARLDDASGLDFEMIRLDLIHRTMERETKTNIIFLDACRDNPLSRNLARAMGTRSTDIGHGLAAVESGVGTLISFSTQPGNVALDGDGRNSPFATSLVKRISAQGEDVSSILINVRNDVMQSTNNRQIPWEHSALRSKLYFGDPSGPADSTNSAGKQAEVELASWSAAKASGSISGLEYYLQRYPHGAFAGSAKLLIDQYRQEEAKRAELAAREAELKKAEQAKQLPALKQAEDQRRAEEAKRAQELALARKEVQEAQAAVKAAEAARLAAVNAAEEARKAAEAAKGPQAQAQGDAIKVASLAPAVDRSTMSRLIQTELKRVGCDPGSADGAWGPKAEEALAKFARLANVSLSKEPTTEALQAVAAHKARVCPLVCGAGEVLTNDKCVAKAKPEPKPAQQAKRQAAPEVKPSGSGMCFAAGGNSSHAFVPCDHPQAARKAF